MAVATAEIPRATPGSLEAGDAFTGLAKAPGGWGAITIGSVLYLFFFLVIPWLLARGWLVAYGRAVAAGETELPKWTLEYVWDGLRNVFVGLVYWLPMLVISSVLIVPLFVELVQSVSSGVEPSPDAFSRIFQGQLAFIGLSQLYQLAVAAIRPAADAVFVADDKVLPCLTPSRLKSVIRPFGGGYFLAPVIVYAVGLVAGFGILLCCVGVAATYFYLRAIEFHFAGQIARAQN